MGGTERYGRPGALGFRPGRRGTDPTEAPAVPAGGPMVGWGAIGGRGGGGRAGLMGAEGVMVCCL